MDAFDIKKYIDMAFRRKWWIIFPFLVVLLAGLAYGLKAPKVYEVRTLILVQPQRVPEDFVRTIVTTTVEDRLRTITQQVTSRTNLEKIIQEYNLFAFKLNMLLDDKVARLREMVIIDVSHTGRAREANAFTITLRGKDPKKITEVTNALASNFISENLKIRESQAMGTSSFISDELESVRKRLMEKEEDLKQYRERYMGGLPEQLQANLSILERLQQQLDQLNSNLRDAGNRKAALQTQFAEQQRPEVGAFIPSASQEEEPRDIPSLRNELASLEARYTQNHPDVIRLKEMIVRLEAQRAQTSQTPADSPEISIPVSREAQALKNQLQDITLEMESYKAGIKKVQSQVKWYEKKVEDTPKREQELLTLNRDYQNLNELYNSLLNRKLEAEMAVSMERKQKGEQFRIVDPAKIPIRPVEPDLRRIMLLTLALGLGLGGGLAFLIETMDTSFKIPEEVEKELQLPVLVSMPIRYTVKELRRIKIKKILAFSSVTLSFLASAAGIIFAIKGVDETMSFVENLLSRF
jgi:polysaccharide chain length determinant protein (PEP-CTERM system associated)